LKLYADCLLAVTALGKHCSLYYTFPNTERKLTGEMKLKSITLYCALFIT